MAYLLRPIPAVDPAQAQSLAKNADGLIYATTDTALSTPLAVTDPTGSSLVAVHVNELGLTQAFISPNPEVVWVSGTYRVVLTSYQAMLDQMAANIATVTQLRDQVTSALSLLQSGAGGTAGGATRHSQLSGLDADDHPQYLTNGRGDVRYYTQAAADNKTAAAVSAASSTDRNRANHSGSQDQSSVSGLVAALVARLQVVIVATGAELRPSGSAVVMWIDARTGAVNQPTNMATGTDIWLSQQVPAGSSSGGGTTTPPASDTTAPTVPTGLTSSNVSQTGFTVSWTASTDAVGVTGYDVQVGGVSVGTPTATTFTVTGRTAGTAYSVRVRARDAAGNYSALSTAITVTTSAASTVLEHTVFGSTAFPGASSAIIYQVSGEIVASGFRLAADQGKDWRVKGMRLYVPNVSGTVPSTANFYIVKAPSPTLSSITTTNLGSATMTGIAKGAWTEVRLATPVSFGYYDRVWIACKFSDGTFFSYPNITTARVPATDGSAIGLEAADARGNQYDPAGGQSSTQAVWGIDLIVDEGV